MLSGRSIDRRNNLVVELETFRQNSIGYLSWEHVVTSLKRTLKKKSAMK